MGAPPILWLVIFLSLLPAIDQMFSEDVASGICEVILTAPMPLSLYALAKCLAQWAALQPLLLAASLCAFVFFALPLESFWALYGALLPGSLAAIFLGSIAAALTAPLRRSGALTALLAFPLFLPLLIFGSAAASQKDAFFAAPSFLYLSLLLLLAFLFCPFAAGAALKNALS